jgi:hypothetical protein
MRLSSTATVALFSLLALRPVHAQTTPEDAQTPSVSSTPTQSDPDAAAPPKTCPGSLTHGSCADSRCTNSTTSPGLHSESR